MTENKPEKNAVFKAMRNKDLRKKTTTKTENTDLGTSLVCWP